MITAVWAILVALATMTAPYGGEAGVSDYAGHPTVLICAPSACVGFVLVDGGIVTLPE